MANKVLVILALGCLLVPSQELISLEAPDRVIVIAGDDANIDIAVETYDNDTVTLEVYKDGVVDDSQTKHIIGNGTVPFTFNSVSETSAGPYVFSAFNAMETNRTNATTQMEVHVRVRIDVLYPTFIFSPVTDGPSHVTCIAYGIPPVKSCRWHKGTSVSAEEVTYERGNGVYQIRGPDNATLSVDEAMLTDDGVYTCVAMNEVGETGLNVIATNTTTLAVYGSPEILSVTAGTCTDGASPSITVEWEPDDQTVAVKHRIRLLSTNSTGHSEFAKIVKYEDDKLVKFTALEPYTEYEITIHVCPDGCITQLNTSNRLTTTHGVPGDVKNVVVIQEEGQSNCTAEWEWPDTPRDQILHFKVTWTNPLVCQSPDSGEEEVFITTDTRQTIAMQPNRQYKASIVAVSCAGKGEPMNSESTCIGKSESSIPSATVTQTEERSKTREIEIELPDETRGPISCTFVIISRDKQFEVRQFTLNDLYTFESNAKSKTGLSNGYISLAVARKEMTYGKSTKKILGTGETTSCNLVDIPEPCGKTRSDTKADVFIDGTNIELDINGVTYWYMTIVTTPTGLGSIIVIQQSASQSFVNGASLAWIAPVVVGAFLLVLITVIVCIRKKKSRQKETNKTHKSKNKNRELPPPPKGNQFELYEGDGYEKPLPMTSMSSQGGTHVYEQCIPDDGGYDNIGN